MTKSVKTALVDDDANGEAVEQVEHIVTLGEVLTIFLQGVALRPDDKETVQKFIDSLSSEAD